MSEQETGHSEPKWTFLTNHTHVLVCLAQNPCMSLRQVAERIGITERFVQKIVSDLVDAGILSKTKVGRCNTYSLHAEKPLRHPLEKHRTLAEMLQLILEKQ